MTHRLQKRAFTLIEITIVLALMGSVFSLFSFSFLPFYKSYKFQAECQLVYDVARELQIQALMHRSDMHLIFHLEKKGWQLTTDSDERIIKPHLFHLSHIHKITEGEETKGDLTLTFYPSGRVHPEKAVTLLQDDRAYTLYFDSPCLITSHPYEGASSPLHSLEEKIKATETLLQSKSSLFPLEK
ncbi:MAG: prepilin-type N-terminal cleavage/methylation domain-containing protein [Candidatus Rhabdochlamydia sp.]